MDKYTATWLSHSSISDYLACPRSYYLKNVYKDPQTNHKIQVITPALTLGSVVHEVLENLAVLPTATRWQQSLIEIYEREWPKFGGEAGGFFSPSLENEYKERGRQMLACVQDNPGPLKNLAVKIKGDLPYYELSVADNLILCGKLDWLEFLPATNSVHIIDFKTSRRRESESSLQLPIYLLLATNCQRYQVEKASYWYLALAEQPEEKKLPELDVARQTVLDIGRRISVARKLNTFKCPHGGCPACEPFERILRGDGKKVGESNKTRRDTYVLTLKPSDRELEEIL